MPHFSLLRVEASEIAQLVQIIARKLEDLVSVPCTNMVEEEI